jgi:hypothetical protein
MKLNWKDYPVGADICLFDEGFQMLVVRNISPKSGDIQWWLCFPHCQYGAVYPIPPCKTKEEAIEAAEEWFFSHIKKLFEL